MGWDASHGARRSRSPQPREKHIDPNILALFGGLLDYCLRLDEDNAGHTISIPRGQRTSVYSGYIWKCVAPKQLLLETRPC